MNRIAGILNRRPPLERAAWLLAALCVILAVVAAGTPTFTNASRPVRGILDPEIALQTVRGMEEIDAILSDAPSPDREVMRVKQYVDFCFTAAYAALFGVIAAGVARLHPASYGIAIALIAGTAALLDVFENLAVLQIVGTSLQQVSPAMLDQVRLWSAWKSALQAASIFACGAFFCLSPRWQTRLAGLAGAAVAVLIIAALFKNAFLQWVGPALTAALCAHAVTLKFLTHEPTSRNPVSRSV